MIRFKQREAAENADDDGSGTEITDTPNRGSVLDFAPAPPYRLVPWLARSVSNFPAPSTPSPCAGKLNPLSSLMTAIGGSLSTYSAVSAVIEDSHREAFHTAAYLLPGVAMNRCRPSRCAFASPCRQSRKIHTAIEAAPRSPHQARVFATCKVKN